MYKKIEEFLFICSKTVLDLNYFNLGKRSLRDGLGFTVFVDRCGSVVKY